MGDRIVNATATHAGRFEAGLSLLFAGDGRPDAAAIAQLAKLRSPDRALARFSISHRADDDAGWLELLSSGLIFDLAGLAPSAPSPLPPCQLPIGLAGGVLDSELEAVSLAPGSHLSGGEAILPIVRVHIALAAVLAELPNVAAVAWHPARTWIETGYFVRTVSAWLDGGVFPALGLTGLVSTSDGGLETAGLAFFLGRELKVPAGLAPTGADTAKLAMRLIHNMVEAGPGEAAGTYITDQGQEIEVRESDDGGYLEVHQSGA